MVDRPYFMSNKDWYEFDFKTRRFILSEKAPKEAEKSLNEYYKNVTERISHNQRNGGTSGCKDRVDT